ncbi:Uncharacterised protein [uncultured archaeon]|nr:Uncharacterised protein [uncultured archaeon]
MESSDILFLSQLVKSLEEASVSLEQAYEKKSFDKFNQSKKIMIKIQKEISEILK